ncbi:MAG: hypothetical protein SPE43_08960 [Ruminococcus sp.]|nr:hypothetical protein [Ruminococcus sp.]
MNAVLHMPVSTKKIKELEIKIAKLHAEIALKHIQKEVKTKDDAVKLINLICDKQD